MSNIVRPAIEEALHNTGNGFVVGDPYYDPIIDAVSNYLEDALTASRQAIYAEAIHASIDPRLAESALVKAGLLSKPDGEAERMATTYEGTLERVQRASVGRQPGKRVLARLRIPLAVALTVGCLLAAWRIKRVTR
jgi:hypothetical protein